MKKVLIISYYFPPSGGSGVQRVLKFVKYLPLFGWQPVIYTVENGEYPVIDNSLEKDIPSSVKVIRKKIREPYRFYKLFTGLGRKTKISPGFLYEDDKLKLPQKISRWIRGNMFIPDARKFWIKPSVNFLAEYLKSNPVDVIISSGPPHSVHLIALKLRQKLGIPWLADFRDPWTNIYYYKNLHLSKRADKKHHLLENEVIKTADHITVVGEIMKNDFNEVEEKISIITNGFDEDDIPESEPVPDEKFSLVYTGYLLRDENPEILWRVLSELTSINEQFASDIEVKLIGKTDSSVSESIRRNRLENFVTIIPYQPHGKVIEYQRNAQVLLLLLNDSQEFRRVLTGKLFEYLSAGRPILSIGSTDANAVDVIKETKSGEVIGKNDIELLREKLLDFYNNYKNKNLYAESCNIQKYSRKELTHQLSSILNKLSEKTPGIVHKHLAD